MEDFEKYWNKKAKKCRRSWVDKLVRRLDNHTGIDDIQKDVFKPFNHKQKFDDFRGLIESHYTKKNPLAEWRRGRFRFSENGLREALQQRGRNLDEFKLRKEHSVCDIGHYTDLDTLTLTYGAATMIIKRFSTKGVPFGFYEITPCTRFDDNCPMRMGETGFYTLDIATLLMEMDCEYKLREEEFKYYAKRVRLALLEAAVANEIEFELWDDTMIPVMVKKIVESDEYSCLEKVLHSALDSWLGAVWDFMVKITRVDKDQEKLIFKAWGYNYGVTQREYAKAYVKNVLNPYLDSHGLQDAVVYVHEKNSDVVIEYQGCKMLLKDGSLDVSRYHCYCYPYADEKDSIFNSSFFASPKSYYAFNISFKILTLSAIARYVKIMPKYKDIIYGMKEKVQKVYNEIKG